MNFSVTDWVLKNRIKEGQAANKNIYKFIEHVVNNLFPLNEYGPNEMKRFINQFKEEADDLNIEISDAELEAAIKRFDQLKNSPKIIEKDLQKYNLAKLLKLVGKSPGADVPEGEETGPDVLYSADGYTIFSGGNEELCQRHRSEVPWCITRTSFGNYRYASQRNFPSFYLVKNANLPDSDELSFVAIQVRGNGEYVYTNRDNSPHESKEMSWETLNSEIPWLRNIPNAKSLMRHIPLSTKEKMTQLYSKNSISFRDWENLPFETKKQYLIIRKNKDLFSDISVEEFVEKYLPDYPQLATFISTNADIINTPTLLKNLDKFSPNDRKSIIANLREKISVKEYLDGQYKSVLPFDVKKLLVKLDKWDTGADKRLYVTQDGQAIVKLTFGDEIKVGVYTEERDYPNIKLNQRTSKFLLDYPNLDKIPLPSIIQLVDKEVVGADFINKILEKAKDDPNSAIVVKDTDTGKIVLDSNSFTSYKIEGGKLQSIPFSSEEVQNVLKDETGNTGFQTSAVNLVLGTEEDLPQSIDKKAFIDIINSTPYNKRTGVYKGKGAVVLAAADPDTRNKVFVMPTEEIRTYPLSTFGYDSDFYIRRGSMTLDNKGFKAYIKYLRDVDRGMTDDEIKNILFRVRNHDKAKAIVEANPLMAAGSVFKPVLFQNRVLLVNSANPAQSFIISERTGKLLNKVITASQARQLLGGAAGGAEAPAAPVAAPAAGERRRGRPAGAARPAAPAVQAGEGAVNTAAIFAEYNLQGGWNNLPAARRTQLANAVIVAPFNSRGATRRNNMLGNRGRVVRVLEAGPSSIYIIRLADGRHVASINTQPGNGHFLVLPDNRVLNIGSPSNLVTSLQQANLAESLSHIAVSEFLAQNPTMIDEAKDALRLIIKNKNK